MKLISWNVNGLRSCISKGLLDFINEVDPDYLCLQEIKISKDDLDTLLATNIFKDYTVSYSCATKRRGYSGVLTLSKNSPNEVLCSLDIQDIDNEGRFLVTKFENFSLVNAYFPHSDRSLKRLPYKHYFNAHYLAYLKSNLDFSKPIVLAGDFNVAHNEIDLARPKQNMKNPGFTFEERAWFTKLLSQGFIPSEKSQELSSEMKSEISKLEEETSELGSKYFIDTFRFMNPEKVQYTWWSYMHNAREKNVGWRIDYFLISQKFKDIIISSDILDNVMGSDHCPVQLILDDLSS